MNERELLDPLKKKIIKKYARLLKNGNIMFCKPSQLELDNPALRRERGGSDRKVIYDNEVAADNCARELLLIGGKAQYAYPCGRSSHNHHHLSTDREFAQKIIELRRVQNEIGRELRSRRKRRR